MADGKGSIYVNIEDRYEFVQFDAQKLTILRRSLVFILSVCPPRLNLITPCMFCRKPCQNGCKIQLILQLEAICNQIV